MQIGRFPRIPLGEFPTPLQRLERLTRALGGPQLFLKRDDLSGLGLGGNKLRKLEYALAEAAAGGATALLTAGGIQSNHVRLTIAAGCRLGLKTYAVLKGDAPKRATGNLLIDRMLGVAGIRYVRGSVRVTRDQSMSAVEEEVARWSAELAAAGEVPYFIPNGCRPLHGALGYAGCVLEIVRQLRDQELAPDVLVTACGTSSTQTGLLLGASLYTQDEAEVIGISVSGCREDLVSRIARQLHEAWEALSLTVPLREERILIHDEYVGEGYGIPTPGMVDAVRLLARTEGIVLDPVYTGKALAGLVDLIDRGRFSADQAVVLIHTGGVPGLFADAQVEAFQE